SFKERVTLILYIIAVSFKVALFDRNSWHHYSEIAIRRLNDGFIVINQRFLDIDFDNSETLAFIGFINPSLEDFLKYYINKNYSEIERILMSSKHIKQWYFFFKPYVSNRQKISIKLIDHLRKFGNTLISKKDFNNDYYLTSIFDFYFNTQNETPIANSFLLKISNWEFLKGNDNSHFYSKKFLNEIKSNQNLNKIISNFSPDFFIYSLLNEGSLDEFLDLFKLFLKHFNINTKILKSNSILFDRTKNLFNQKVNESYYFLEKVNVEKDYHIELIRQLEESKEYIQNSIYSSFSFDIEYIIDKNWNYNASINLIEQSNPSKTTRIEDYDSYADEMIPTYEDFYYHENRSLDDIINDELERRKKTLDNFSHIESDDDDDLPF
ncbi:hypothetical protein ACFSYG_13050, partial [Leeuwenhoekiella polynyae]